MDTLYSFIVQAGIYCDVQLWSVTTIFDLNTSSSDAATASGLSESAMTKNYFTAILRTLTS